MLIINEKDILLLTEPTELTSVVENSMRMYASGNFMMPDRMHMDINGNTLLLMPAAAGDYFGTKLVSLFPDNPAKDQPVLYGTVILNDGETGQPLALFNGARLTAVRTAAVGSAGIRYTAGPESNTLGLIGTGVQGLHQVWFACVNHPVFKVMLYDENKDLIEPFIRELEMLVPGVELVQAESSEDLTQQSDIIITATNSSQPVLPNIPDILKGKHIIAIGSYKENMKEIPRSVYSLINQVYVDVDLATEESGDLIHPLRKGWIAPDQVALLSDLFDADPLDLPVNDTTLYKSVGMALFDLFTAEYLYSKAVGTGIGQRVEW